MEQKLTFDQLPNAVTMLIREVSELKRLLIEKQEKDKRTINIGYSIAYPNPLFQHKYLY